MGISQFPFWWVMTVGEISGLAGFMDPRIGDSGKTFGMSYLDLRKFAMIGGAWEATLTWFRGLVKSLIALQLQEV